MYHKTLHKLSISLAASSLVLLCVGAGLGAEPHGLGRFFRFGKDSSASAASSKPSATVRPTPRGATTGAIPTNDGPRPIFGPDAPGMPNPSVPDVGAGSTRFTPSQYAPATTTATTATTAYSTVAPVTNANANAGSAMTQKLRPQPRNSKAATEADPILTRVALGRTDDGKQFGMFLQVYADGTVIDSEGVHHVGADVMQPLGQALQAGELSQLKGHCGGPPTDFIEQVHITIYERYRGRLRANNFSFSGNPAGCDPAVRTLHAAIEALQLKISGPPVTTTTTAVNTAPIDTQAPAPPALGLTVER
jgi:hypothetical protein